jgi:hypothetical protein
MVHGVEEASTASTELESASDATGKASYILTNVLKISSSTHTGRLHRVSTHNSIKHIGIT